MSGSSTSVPAASRAWLGNSLVGLVLLLTVLPLAALHTGDWWVATPRSGRWWSAGLALLVYAGLCLRYWRRSRPAPTTATDPDTMLLIGWASQTGFARELAEHTASSLQAAGMAVQLLDLARLDATTLAQTPHVLFVVSTTGEGDPPDHALGFIRRVMAAPAALAPLRYGVLALGDRGYTHYCGFGHALDRWLRQSGATPLFDLVEVDNGDPMALQLWQQQLSPLGAMAGLPGWSSPHYDIWSLDQRVHCNPGSAGMPVFRISLHPPGEHALAWQAGDIAEIAPCNPPAAVDAFLQATGLSADTRLDDGNTTLGELLACSYLPDPVDAIPDDIQALTGRLKPLPQRAYSIASVATEGHIELLVRLAQRPDGSSGLGSGWLCEHAGLQAGIALRIRSNPNFHVPPAGTPLILIGNGTGIAGLRALLKARELEGSHDNWLLFGERNADHDLHFREDLLAWQADGHLQRVDLAFSRDTPERHYVQHALQEAAGPLRAWVERGAALYVCGSLEGMAPAVDATLREILGTAEVDALLENGRYRRDVY